MSMPWRAFRSRHRCTLVWVALFWLAPELVCQRTETPPPQNAGSQSREAQSPDLQSPAPQSSGVPLPDLEEEIQAIRDLLEASTDLQETLRARVQASIQDAVDALAEAGRQKERRATLDAQQKDAPELLERLATEPAEALPFGTEVVAPASGTSVAAAEEQLRQAEVAMVAVRQAATQRDEERRQLEERRDALPERLIALTQALQGLVAPAQGDGEPPILLRAAMVRYRAERERLLATKATLELEQAAMPSLIRLAVLRAERAGAWRDRAETGLVALKDAVRAVQEDAAKARAAAERDQIQKVDPRLQPILQRNAALSEQLSATTDARTDAERLDELSRAKALQGWLEEIQQEVDALQGKEILGTYLREQLEQLRDTGRVREAAQDETQSLDERINQAQRRRIEYKRGLARLGSLSAAARLELRRSGPNGGEAYPAALLADAESFLKERKETLQQLRDKADDEVRALVDLSRARATRLDAQEALEGFLMERILWVRSKQPLWEASWVSVQEGLGWWVSSGTWAPLLAGLGDTPSARWLLGGLMLLLALALLVWRRRGLAQLKEQAILARQLRTTSFAPTARALLVTFLLAATAPLVLLAGATWVDPGGGGDSLRSAFPRALQGAAVLWFALRLVRQITRENGLGEAHFNWRGEVMRGVAQQTRLLAYTIVPMVILRGLMRGRAPDDPDQVVERVLLTAVLVITAIYLWRVLHPKHGLMSGEGGVGGRFRDLFAVACAAVPLVLAGQTVFGFSYTAEQLLGRLNGTMLLAGLSVLVYSLSMRGQLLARRQLAVRVAAERLARLKAESLEESGGAPKGEGEGPPTGVEEELDLAAVNHQTRKLIRAVSILVVLPIAWFLWVDVLPALNHLQSVEVWGSVSVSADGAEVREVVTLGNLLIALLLLAGTVVATKNIPGLLELTVLSRLNMGPGERHAGRTLARYVITALGLVFAFQAIGIGWSKVQWLVAAVSVGLGFGLQEIFANFVSGLIILFERPIRVGDLVTVSGIEGYVTRIQMRATTVTDFDRREIVIPNKEFITASVVNWTLTDPITRVIIPVGVAYGTDPNLVHNKLLAAAKKCSKALSDPAPFTVFNDFGDSTLNFDVRVYMARRTDWLEVMNEVRSNIANDFAAANIEIAFPQRDINVRSIEGLDRILAERSGQ